MEERGTIWCCESNEDIYPKRLRNYDNMPNILYVKGELPFENKKTVAIVGARTCSRYGEYQAYTFAKELAGCGVQIISGLARGIDGSAHRGAIDGGGKTFAVMGCGADVCYPVQNKFLYQAMTEGGGGIISEFPMGMPPYAGNFPRRNRIISGLADLVLIIEAKNKSGSLITAGYALEQGKTVYALPGRVGDALSQGCNQLIADGAGIADSVETILAELKIADENKKDFHPKSKIRLASEEEMVYSCLGLQPKNIEEIFQEIHLESGRILGILLKLELDGLIEEPEKIIMPKQEDDMAKYLVIVESPAKVKTIKKFLGSNYEVMASNGHVRDLPKSQLGIDVEHDYEPKYITIRGKGDILAALRKSAKKADKVYLATDPDREGEAISWHLSNSLKLDEKKMRRITFNEITKTAVKASIKEARDINMDLVDAQQTRRMLDRMVGYEISPVLWAKVKRGLSAGRVQSVALRIIGDREEEINNFIPEEYWTLDAEFSVEGEKKPLTAKFYGTKNKKMAIHSREELENILKGLDGVSYQVSEVKKGERHKKAPLPFTTSTLQQEASKVLNFSTQKTMRLAQQLYEGVDVKGSGTMGIITYLRTDSTRISDEADAAARTYITSEYGEEYVAAEEKKADSKKKIQDAHEAIRPTDISRTPLQMKESLTRDQYRLYQLIWKRFAASRMQQAVYETTSVKINGGEYYFTVAASKLKFDGFMAVYTQDDEEKADNQLMAKSLDENTKLELKGLKEQQHFTQPPAHYTEAALVKTMEELGIGRPSTYAPTITTIIARRYVAKENKNLYMTELGEVVNNIMKEAFASIVDVHFTATLEELLDCVGEGKVQWKTVIRNFYPDLEEAVKTAQKELEQVKIEDEVTDVICEQCGRNMVVKYGPHGKFLACPGFPDCKNTKPYLEKIGVPCPVCGKDVVVKRSKKGRLYYGCENNPDCEFMSWQKPSKEHCPSCNGYMLEKGNKLVCANEQCGYVMVKPKDAVTENKEN